MSKNFQNQIRTLEETFHRTAMLVKNNFVNYAIHPTNQIFESPILLESLEGYNGKMLKNELSTVIEICFLESLQIVLKESENLECIFIHWFFKVYNWVEIYILLVGFLRSQLNYEIQPE